MTLVKKGHDIGIGGWVPSEIEIEIPSQLVLVGVMKSDGEFLHMRVPRHVDMRLDGTHVSYTLPKECFDKVGRVEIIVADPINPWAETYEVVDTETFDVLVNPEPAAQTGQQE